MSDKNFKVKNGIDSTGPVTITTPNTSTTGLIINVPGGGKSISFLRDGTERASIDDWGSFTTNGINVVQPWWVRSPGIDTQSFFWVGAGSRSSVGIAGTNSGTNPVVYISQNGTATNDLTQWLKPDNTILAKVDYLGSIYNSGLVEIGRTKTSDGSSAVNFITVGSYAGAGGQSTISRGSGYNGSLVLTNYGNGSIILNQGGTNILTITNTGSATFSSDLTVTGNFTVNGTTTNLNSTNLVVEDKNIIIADVATPTDTTADGAGITIKGATDKTFNWVESTGSFTSSEPLIINTNSTTRPNLILKPIASQTSAVQEWQSSTGAVLANIDKSGYFRGPLVEVSPTNPALYGIAIAANASQTGDLFQITNSSNNAYTGVSSTGKFVTGNTANVSRFTQITDAALGQLTVYSPSASTKSIVIRADASQTANLQEWQNSSGTVLSSISSNGNLVSNLSGTSTTFPIFVYTTSSATTPYGIAVARQNRSDQYIHIHESDGSKAVIEAVAPNAAKPFFIKNKSNEALYLGTNDTNRFSITSTGLIGVGIDTPSSAQMTLINSNSANTGLLIKGAASQTANLQEWQDSAGTVLVKVRSSGQLNVGGAVAATTLGVLNIDPAWTALKVIGAASQTGNLQEWQDSSGTVLAFVNQAGTARFYMLDNLGLVSIGTSTTGSASLKIDTNITTRSGIIIKGVASQTANLTEWQNNSGTVLAKIDKDGIITVPAINVVGQSISSNTTMIAGYRYFVDTSASRTLTLPSSATIGDEIQIFDSTNTAGTNNITINSNNGKIEGVVESYIIDVNGAAIVMTYTGSTYGWKVRM